MRDDGGSHISDADVVMEYSQELLDFINSPDTVDFIAAADTYWIILNTIQMSSSRKRWWIVMYSATLHAAALNRWPDYWALAYRLVSIVLGLLNREALNKSGIIQVHNQPYLGLKGSNVLVGIVDTGIDFTQPPFIYDDGTSKIQYIYDETGVENTPLGL